jgi:hypothetical protein
MSRSILSRPLPRSWSIFIAAIVIFGAASVFRNTPSLYVYLKHWGATSSRVSVPYADFTADMDERALHANLSPLPVRCIDESFQANGLGERVCYAAIDEADGAPALTFAAFFHHGKLARALVHVPWWGHHAMVRSLVARFGPPVVIESSNPEARLVHWRLQRGTVTINRDPGWDPLTWSTVLWLAETDKRPTSGR